MIFKPELALAVLEGRKTVTRRLCSDNPRSPWWRDVGALEVGRDYAVQSKRGTPAIARIRVLDVRRETLIAMRAGPVAEREARAEGFGSLEAFKNAWLRINGSWEPLAEVWRIEFEMVQPSALDEFAKVVRFVAGELLAPYDVRFAVGVGLNEVALSAKARGETFEARWSPLAVVNDGAWVAVRAVRNLAQLIKDRQRA